MFYLMKMHIVCLFLTGFLFPLFAEPSKNQKPVEIIEDYNPLTFDPLDTFIDIFYQNHFENKFKKARLKKTEDTDVLQIVAQSNLGKNRTVKVWELEPYQEFETGTIAAFAMNRNHIFILKNFFSKKLCNAAAEESIVKAISAVYEATLEKSKTREGSALPSYDEFRHEIYSLQISFDEIIKSQAPPQSYEKNELRKQVVDKARAFYPPIIFNLKKFVLLHELKHLEFNHHPKRSFWWLLTHLSHFAFFASLLRIAIKAPELLYELSQVKDYHEARSFTLSLGTPPLLALTSAVLIKKCIFVPHYSHTQELQADTEAIKEGGLPLAESALLFFSSLHICEGPNNEASETHPSFNDRIKNIQELMKNLAK